MWKGYCLENIFIYFSSLGYQSINWFRRILRRVCFTIMEEIYLFEKKKKLFKYIRWKFFLSVCSSIFMSTWKGIFLIELFIKRKNKTLQFSSLWIVIRTIWHYKKYFSNLISLSWQLISQWGIHIERENSICFLWKGNRSISIDGTNFFLFHTRTSCSASQISGKWLSILMERDPFTSHSFAHFIVYESCQITHFELSSALLLLIEGATERPFETI